VSDFDSDDFLSGGNGSWGSNTTLDEIALALRRAGSVLVLTHTKPDGDAIGSSIASVRALRLASGAWRDGSKIKAVFTGPTPAWVGEVANRDEWMTADEAKEAETPRGLLVVDTGAWKQLEDVSWLLRGRAVDTCLIDHHLDGSADVAGLRWVETKAAAACVAVGSLCQILLGKSSAAELPERIATPLYLGLATDTGWFRHSNTDSRTLRMAADLRDAGADHDSLFRAVEQNQSLSRIRLLAGAMHKIELHAGGRLAVIVVSPELLAETAASVGDTGGLSSDGLMLSTVLVSAVLTPGESEGVVKISLRSKSGPSPIAVNEVAAKLGGGGHRQAAGARMEGTMAQVKKRLIELVTAALDGGDQP